MNGPSAAGGLTADIAGDSLRDGGKVAVPALPNQTPVAGSSVVEEPVDAVLPASEYSLCDDAPIQAAAWRYLPV